jgi:hypothetical protein
LASGCGVATRGNLLVDSQGQLLTGVSEVVTSWTLAPGGGDTIRLEPRFSINGGYSMKSWRGAESLTPRQWHPRSALARPGVRGS